MTGPATCSDLAARERRLDVQRPVGPRDLAVVVAADEDDLAAEVDATPGPSSSPIVDVAAAAFVLAHRRSDVDRVPEDARAAGQRRAQLIGGDDLGCDVRPPVAHGRDARSAPACRAARPAGAGAGCAASASSSPAISQPTATNSPVSVTIPSACGATASWPAAPSSPAATWPAASMPNASWPMPQPSPIDAWPRLMAPTATWPIATRPTATWPTAMMPTAVGRRPLDGSMPRTTCTSGNPKTFSRDRYSKLDGAWSAGSTVPTGSPFCPRRTSLRSHEKAYGSDRCRCNALLDGDVSDNLRTCPDGLGLAIARLADAASVLGAHCGATHPSPSRPGTAVAAGAPGQRRARPQQHPARRLRRLRELRPLPRRRFIRPGAARRCTS